MQTKIKYKIFLDQYLFYILNKKRNMSTDSYSLRLRQIREKYGNSVKDNTACLKSYERPSTTKYDLKNYENYTSANRLQTNTYKRPERQTKPVSDQITKTYFSIDINSKDLKSRFDTSTVINNYSSRDERLKEIEKIRSNFAKSRTKAVDDWQRQVEKSRSKVRQSQKYSLSSKQNQNQYNFNPEQVLTSKKNYQMKQNTRYRAQSSYAIGSALDATKDKLKRNYDYDLKQQKQNRVSEYKNQKPLRTLIKDFDKQNYKKSSIQDFAFKTHSTILNTGQSQTTSPIKGLSKFDSVEKLKKVSIDQRSYDLSKIDSIQDRIQRILGKK